MDAKKKISIFLTIFFFILTTVSAKETYWRLRQLDQNNNIDFVIWKNTYYNDTSDIFYKPLAVIKTENDEQSYAYFNLVPDEIDVYKDILKKDVVNDKKEFYDYVVMFYHDGMYYVGHSQNEHNKGTSHYLYLEFEEESKALEMLYIYSYIRYYEEKNGQCNEVKITPLGTITDIETKQVHRETIENNELRYTFTEKDWDTINRYYGNGVVYPPKTISSVSINIATYYDSNEIYDRIKYAYGYYTSLKNNSFMYKLIYLDETNKDTFKKTDGQTYYRKDFIVKWSNIDIEKL